MLHKSMVPHIMFICIYILYIIYNILFHFFLPSFPIYSCCLESPCDMLRVFSEGKPELQAFRWHGCETGPRHQRASARVTASKNKYKLIKLYIYIHQIKSCYLIQMNHINPWKELDSLRLLLVIHGLQLVPVKRNCPWQLDGRGHDNHNAIQPTIYGSAASVLFKMAQAVFN